MLLDSYWFFQVWFVKMYMLKIQNFLIPNTNICKNFKKTLEYYRPSTSYSLVVDKGVDVGFSFEGIAPDIGAVDY